MSIIFGVISHNEEAIDDRMLQSMYEPLKGFPQQKSDKIQKDEAAFGRVLRYQTPEDVFDSQPVYLQQPDIIFTAQGRIDNREELYAALGIQANDTVSDSYFMLIAYLKYGKTVQQKLKGDWCLAVYDYQTKELFITRDTMGYTAIYYYNTSQYFAFSTSLKSLLALPYFNKELNESYFVSFLSLWNFNELIEGNQTLYKQVFFLKAGFTLSLKKNQISINQYWPPANITETYYKNKLDYTDRMSELINKAVKARLRSHKPVASMLSGGLDSSMVSYIAATLLKQQNQSLTTFSHVPLFKSNLTDNPMANSRVVDETPLIKALVEASGNINAQYMDSAQLSPWQGSIESIEVLDGFLHGASNAYWLVDIYKTSAQQGYGVLLTGEGGNGSTSFAGLDYQRPHSLNRFIRTPYNYLRRQIAKPLVLKYFRSMSVFNDLEAQIKSGYLSAVMLAKYNIMADIGKKDSGFLKYYQHVLDSKIYFHSLYQMRSLLGATFGNHYGIELRDPTTDVDLMNFFYTIPNEVFFDNNFTNRMLVKRMMHNQMPDEVLFAKNKGLQSSDILYRVRNSKTEIINELPRLETSGIVAEYIEMGKLKKDLNRYLNGNNEESPLKIQTSLKTLQAVDFLSKYF